MSYAGPVSHRKRAATSTSDSHDSAQPAPDAPTHAGSTQEFKPLPRYSTKGDQTGIFVAGVALGLIVGAGAALLLAPQSGADTRNAIARRSRRLTKRGRNAFDDLRWELRQFRRDLQRKSLSRRAASSL